MKLVSGVLDLHLVPLMHRVPRVVRRLWHANEDTGIGVRGLRLVHDTQDRIRYLLSVVDEQPHPAGSLEGSVLHREPTSSDMTPTVHVNSVEQLFGRWAADPAR